MQKCEIISHISGIGYVTASIFQADVSVKKKKKNPYCATLDALKMHPHMHPCEAPQSSTCKTTQCMPEDTHVAAHTKIHTQAYPVHIQSMITMILIQPNYTNANS